jgi:PAS domain S-box-containing protein
MVGKQQTEDLLDAALNALSAGEERSSVLDQLPVPAYITDAEGAVTYWNRACVDFAGREPRLGHDRWCVSWQLYTTTGDPLAHEDCPMAQAIRDRRPVRDTIAIAERPDGSRVAFRPYPTPLFDSQGTMTGAINLLIDVTEEQAHSLREQAERCRRLAGALYSRDSTIVLEKMAEGFEQTADGLAQSGG